MPQALRWPLMLLPFALWGTAMAAMRPLLESGSPLQVASLRLLPAGVLVLLAALLLGRSLRVAAVDWPWLLAFALVDGSLFQGLLAQGLGQTGAGLGSVLIDSQPLLVALLARLVLPVAMSLCRLARATVQPLARSNSMAARVPSLRMPVRAASLSSLE